MSTNQLQIDWFEAATAFIAVLSFCLSAYNLYVDRRDKKYRLVVKFDLEHIAGEQVSDAAMTIGVKVFNQGFRPIIITGLWIALPNKERILLDSLQTGKSEYPHVLPEGQNYMLRLPVKDLLTLLKSKGFSGDVKLRAFCQDALDNEFSSKPLPYDIAKHG